MLDVAETLDVIWSEHISDRLIGHKVPESDAPGTGLMTSTMRETISPTCNSRE